MSVIPAKVPITTNAANPQLPHAPTVESIEPEIIDLPRGSSLSDSDAEAFATSRPTRLIVIAGPVASGKTTLLTALYELFQWDRVAGFSFAGSITLPGFEQRCHLSRIESGLSAPETQRSPYKDTDAEYLHLRVATSSDSTITDFLFTDVSGEMFDSASNSIAGCQRLRFLRRATNLLVLLDGDKCTNPNERHATIQKAKTLLQSCLDGDMLHPKCAVNCVWTKCDYFASSDGDTAEFRKAVVADFEVAFGRRISFLEFSEVAARPIRDQKLKYGHGVAELLAGWMSFRPLERPMILKYDPKRGDRESEYFGSVRISSTSEL